MDTKTRQKISRALKGKMPKFIPNNKGIVRSEENKRKISRTLKEKGIKPPRPPRESLCRGKNHRWWKGGISSINEVIRKSPEYKLWRVAVFTRDNFTCIWCGTKDRTLCAECHKTTDTYGKNIWGNEVESDIDLMRIGQ